MRLGIPQSLKKVFHLFKAHEPDALRECLHPAPYNITSSHDAHAKYISVTETGKNSGLWVATIRKYAQREAQLNILPIPQIAPSLPGLFLSQSTSYNSGSASQYSNEGPLTPQPVPLDQLISLLDKIYEGSEVESSYKNNLRQLLQRAAAPCATTLSPSFA